MKLWLSDVINGKEKDEQHWGKVYLNVSLQMDILCIISIINSAKLPRKNLYFKLGKWEKQNGNGSENLNPS